MGSTGQRTDLLRILLADDDDVHAFTIQCTINRLSKPSAFLRVANREVLPQKIRSFEPELLIACGSFIAPGELRHVKTLTNGSPIICLVPNAGAAEASLAAGASDCVLLSQETQLGECLEKHLSGNAGEPHFRAAVPAPRRGRLSATEARLEQLDEKLAAWFRELGRTARHKLGKLQNAASLGFQAARTWTSKQYRRMKVQYLLRKQHRLVQKAVPSGARLGTPGAPRIESAASPERRPLEPLVQNGCPTEPVSHGAEDNADTLRSLELSFKTLFHSSLDAMFLVDALGSILHANPAAYALVGIPAPDLLGRSLFDFVPESDRVRSSAMWEALLVEGQQKTELHVQTASGQQRELFVSARANLWFGVHLVILRDQTEVKGLQREVAVFRELMKLDYHTSTGPFGTGMAARCTEAGSMNDETSGAGR